MKEIKEITLYVIGDSRQISLWSNIPYFFAETLIARGIKVNRVDLSPSPFLEKIYMLTWWRILRLFNRKTSHLYFRSLPHFLDARRRIKKALQTHASADVNLFLTFSFSAAGLTGKPTVLFGDWTYDHFFTYFENREPDFFERRSLFREDSQIEAADLIFPLFSSVSKDMKKRYKNRNIFYLGNVINAVYEPDEKRLLEIKSTSSALLFIGDAKYKEGARQLIRAFDLLRNKHPALTLDIIGLESSEFDGLPAGVTCHGYLDKGKQQERERYYSLLEQARIFINPTPKWGAYSATVEAMYYYTPVIVAPYREFVETFGETIDFGAHCQTDSPDELSTHIQHFLNHPSYGRSCIRARESVQHLTWGAYIDKMLKTMEDKL